MALIVLVLLCGCILLPVGIGLGIWAVLGWKFPMSRTQKLLRAGAAGLAVAVTTVAAGLVVFMLFLRFGSDPMPSGALPFSVMFLCALGVALFVGAGASLSLWLRLEALSPDQVSEN
jgi:drug/metabolite transporter (DMT)-like permease